MSGFASVLTSPAAQSIAMTLLKDLINGMVSKKSQSNDEHKKEIAELKKIIEELIKDKEKTSAHILEMKNNELKRTSQRNEALANEVSNLRRKLAEQEKAGSLSFDLLRERENMLEKINELEGDLKVTQSEKESIEAEAQEFKKECEEQKQSCKELNDLVRVLTKIGQENTGTTPSSSTTNTTSEKEEEVLTKLANLIEKTNVNPEKSKKAKKKKNKNSENKDSSAQNTDTQSAVPVQNMPGPSNMSHMNYMPGMPNMPGMHNMPGPSNMPGMPNMPGMSGPTGQHYYGNMPSPAMDNYGNMHVSNMGVYHNMPGPHMNMQGPYQPNNYNQPLVGPPLQMGMPHQHQNMAPPLFASSPQSMQPQSNFVGSNNWNQHQKNQKFQPNVLNKPNNLGPKQNKNKNNNKKSDTKSDGKQDEKETNEKDSGKSKNAKSGSSSDLWGQLEKLVETINENKLSKSELLSQVPALMTEATKSTIPSKDKFMVELSECVSLINNIPETSNPNDSTSSNQPRRNFKTDFKKSYNKGEGSGNMGRGGFQNRGNRGGGRRFSQGVGHGGNDNITDANQNSDDNNNCSDDEVSSLCSEPAANNRRNFRSDFKKNFNRGEGSGDRGRGGNYRGNNQRGQNFKFYNQRRDQGRDSNNSGQDKNDSDDSASVCSEQGFSNRENRGRGRGRGNWRGGRGNFRGYQKKSGTSNSSGGKTPPNQSQPTPLFPSSNPSSSYPTLGIRDAISSPVEVAQEPKRNQFNPRPKMSPSQNVQKGDDLINFDSPDDTPSQGRAAYASGKILESFIGHEIPSLMDAIFNKIDVTLKVKNCVLVATKNGMVVNEKPHSLLDIIQFKETYPDAVCVLE